MIIDDAKFLKELGLSDDKAQQTLKNKQLSELLRFSYDQVRKYGDIDKTSGNLVYNLATKMKPQIRGYMPLLLEYIGLKKIMSDVQLNAAIDYFLSSPNITYEKENFENACGVGIIVTPEKIEQEVQKVVHAYEESLVSKRYQFNIGILMNEVKKNLKWADGKNVKNEIDIQILKLLGPKKDSDINASITNDISNQSKILIKTNTNSNAKDNHEGNPTLIPKIGQNYLDFYKNLNFHKPGENFKTDGYVITPFTAQLMKDHLNRTGGKVITRFPPEPNGILHLGHAKAINIDFGYAKANGGICYLRYDDTNPEKEEEKFFLGIEEMVLWLGYTPHKITHSSDYFDRLHEYAVRLIENGQAYVCHQTSEEMKGFNPLPSPWRNRDIRQNLELFQDMRKGKIDEGKATLRMKTTLEEGKVDPVAYRIKFVPHHRSGYEWCIYPTYDFTHCLCDSLEDITHSLCTKEFQSRRSSYYWLCNALHVYCPVQWEYGRLNVTHSVVSKRKIAKLIEAGVVKDWDDPRLYTLTALRRKGYPPTAINKFCVSLGVTTALTTVDIEMLESFVRDELNETAPRTMAVLEPLKIHILNWNEIKPSLLNMTNVVSTIGGDKQDWLEIQIPDFPSTAAANVDVKSSKYHSVRLGPNLYVEREDFKEEAEKSYRRLTLNQVVGLRYANISIEVVEILKFPNKENLISQLKVNARLIDSDNKPKAFIHWVSEPSLCEVRLYDKLFLHKNPDNLKEVPEGFLSDINKNSMKSVPYALVDKYFTNNFGDGTFQTFDKFQFERIGYFSIDPDSKPEKLVFNRCVTLKEDSKK